MSFAAYFHDINTQISLVVLFSTCLFAWTKGGKPERLGTLMMLVSWVVTDLLRALDGHVMPTALMFASDGLLSLGFLFIAVRYSSLWLGLAMLFESFTFTVHALQMGDGDAPRWRGMIVYLLLNNILNYLVLACLAVGALATMRQRALARRASAKAPADDRASPLLKAAPPPLASTP